MILKNDIEKLLNSMGYVKYDDVYKKDYNDLNCSLIVDVRNEKIIYPEERGFKITRKTTCNFSEPENFVVLECVTSLFDKGYRPEHIELEKEWTLGHEKKGGFADIVVKGNDKKTLFIIECKTYGQEYKKELNNMSMDGGQLFSYWQQERNCKWLILYSSDLLPEGTIIHQVESINCTDDFNVVNSYDKDQTTKLYRNAKTSQELFEVWDETYDKYFYGDVVFRDDSQAYQIGVKPLRKEDLKDISENDKIVNKFEEILRHNNVSDKENAFNRLIALFICKLVDEIQKIGSDIVDFQYRVGSDTYESLQDRLQRLHKEGMEKFMKEEIFYVSDDYAENLIKQYTGQQRKNMIKDLKNTIRILKFYTNNDFAFKDVHNEELFYQNGKVLVEVVQLFEKYRIIGSTNLQMLGDMFEQLLNKGFKQNEGQFFTPVPITRFLWNSLPIESLISNNKKTEIPKIIDYSCGAGHFLTEGFETIVDLLKNVYNKNIQLSSISEKLYGIEKDYRLARVSKISLFMHGADNGNIIFGDGLENYKEAGIKPLSFDILVANPPYAVSSFKQHLKLKHNTLSILDSINYTGSEIETLFVERACQLVKPNGVCAIILPSPFLNKDNESFVKAREELLKNFCIISIVQLGSETFGATGQNTSVLFLKKYNEPPKRSEIVKDSIDAIFNSHNIADWEDSDILNAYLQYNDIELNEYLGLIKNEDFLESIKSDTYYSKYINDFYSSSIYKNKTKQKSFKDQTKPEQKLIVNNLFKDYVLGIEKEKFEFFAYVYLQKTLIVQSPDGTKEQQQFLGYKWSGRRGQEGIQILNPGGLLYNNENRFDLKTVSGLIKQLFIGEIKDFDGYNEFCSLKNLRDLIDFRSSKFNKIIKTTGYRVKREINGYDIYNLSDKKNFSTFLGNRIISDELLPEGDTPVYSANVYEPFGYTNKKYFNDFNTDSIIWGIDGNWMVNTIDKNNNFYPTDHIGVIRINNKKINSRYLQYSLYAEGELERFSRTNRASVQRIESLSVYIPPIETQNEAVNHIKKIEQKIIECENKISQIDQLNKKEFINQFGMATGKHPFSDVVCDETGSYSNFDSIFYKKTGDIPIIDQGSKFICGYQTNDGIHKFCEKKSIIFGDHTERFKYVDFDFFLGADGTKILTVNDKWNIIYVYYYLLAHYRPTRKYERHFKYLKDIDFDCPKMELQEKFAKFALNNLKQQRKIIKDIETLEIEKEKLITKYFRSIITSD